MYELWKMFLCSHPRKPGCSHAKTGKETAGFSVPLVRRLHCLYLPLCGFMPATLKSLLHRLCQHTQNQAAYFQSAHHFCQELAGVARPALCLWGLTGMKKLKLRRTIPVNISQDAWLILPISTEPILCLPVAQLVEHGTSNSEMLRFQWNVHMHWHNSL